MKNLKLSITLSFFFVAFLVTSTQAQEVLICGLSTNILTHVDVSDDCITKGDNVTIVGFSHMGSNDQLGVYVQVGAKKWQEIGKSGKPFNFRERARDEWSVYLLDKSRGVRIRLDLHTKKIYYKDANMQKEREQFAVMNASCKINGRLACVVDYTNNGQSGVFSQGRDGQWTETNISGTKYTFTETARDDWSIYLQDKSRGYAIQLDLHTGKVMLGKIGEKLQVQYTISGAR